MLQDMTETEKFLSELQERLDKLEFYTYVKKSIICELTHSHFKCNKFIYLQFGERFAIVNTNKLC